MPPTRKEWENLLVCVNGMGLKLDALKEWQENRDEKDRWLSRVIVAALVTSFVGNIASALLSVLGWGVVYIVLTGGK